MFPNEHISVHHRETSSQLRDARRQHRSGIEDYPGELEFEEESLLGRADSSKRQSFPRGRHIAHLIHKHFRETGTNESILDVADLMSVTRGGDNVQGFDTK